ncbi:MAG: C40 family peptidase [Bacteroidales bacterium]|nr:C40 family peptidase [Bacteroidales bacterium]MBN2820037.1 C40 family peptidase [Bacteroidales bacterium]
MKDKNRILDIILYGIGIYLLICLSVSLFVSWQKNTNSRYPTKEQVINYAQLFITDKNLKEVGRKLDCSAYTARVYKKFNIKLPLTAQEQFNAYLMKNGKPNASNLVFFVDNNKINHVGILISDSTFIHSPGNNRHVRVDKLNSNYWKNKYAGTGKILKNNDYETVKDN